MTHADASDDHCARAWLVVTLMAACVSCRESTGGSSPTEAVARRSLTAYAAPPTGVRRVRAGELCFHSGAPRQADAGRWLHLQPRLRATAMNSEGKQAALRFLYLGATPSQRPDAQQEIGIELLSRDACNLVSTTWPVGRRSVVVATVKTNRDFTRLRQCGARGSRHLRAFWETPGDAPVVGSTHDLSATIRQGLLEVRIDDRPVLRAVIAGQDPPAAGSVGLRSDNVKFELLRFEADVLDGPRASGLRCL